MLITTENNLLNDCWQAGVDCILAGEGDEAQVIWLSPFLNDEVEIDEEKLSQSLIDYLSNAVDIQLGQEELGQAYEIAKCLCLMAPDNANALLRLFNISIQSADFDLETLVDPGFIDVLDQALPADINLDLLYVFIAGVADILIEQYIDAYLDLLKLLANKVTNIARFVCVLSAQAFLLGQQLGCDRVQTRILEICLEYAPAGIRFAVLCNLAASTTNDRDYVRSIAIGAECEAEGRKLGDLQHVCGSHRWLAALMEAGDWDQIPVVGQQHLAAMQKFVFDSQSSIKDLTLGGVPYFLNYLYDDPRSLHALRNAIGDLCLQAVAANPAKIDLNQNYQSLPKTKALRIGYIASTLNNHSVGILSRWLFNYHDRSNFQIFVYNVGRLDNHPFNRQFFKDKVDVSHYLGTDAAEIADLIRRDEIDILIDLDSLSMSTTYEVMCRKPAPIAVTWLGWDTSGCPEVDYFIADPYVLPADAEEYYRTKIWRLPETYVAIDGFEIEVPTKCRSDYNLPEDAIVYLCAQKTYKHHPDILRLQMQIIKQVPNSFLMVQMRANPEFLMKTYQKLADEVGISVDRLRFIDADPDELTHRANLQLADVVLDTFPYNGATTTLETLWMGVPMVTKVGQAFVARNSYAFMQNVGVTEGIADTDEEYVDWGVRFGTDVVLRQQVMGKLLHSRKTSPLWDARSFTLEMEQAYRQMWEIYQSNQAPKSDLVELN
jgi:predicted O-linked N-acetylglucosamine transferase (SPINDLY family)